MIFLLQDAESKHQEDTEKIEKEKVDLTEKINDMIKQEAALTAKVIKQKPDRMLFFFFFSPEICSFWLLTLKDRKETLAVQ